MLRAAKHLRSLLLVSCSISYFCSMQGDIIDVLETKGTFSSFMNTFLPQSLHYCSLDLPLYLFLLLLQSLVLTGNLLWGQIFILQIWEETYFINIVRFIWLDTTKLMVIGSLSSIKKWSINVELYSQSHRRSTFCWIFCFWNRRQNNQLMFIAHLETP